ncbi:MAG: hypothetical protein J6J64_06640 [Alistipes sp.]|nr:hypothetical protein [Alistipes sp.]
MKRAYLFVFSLFVLCSIPAIGQPINVKKSFYKELSQYYTIQDSSIFIEYKIPYVNIDVEEVDNLVKDYLSKRIEYSPYVANSNHTYHDNRYLLNEKVNLKITFYFSAQVMYNYVIHMCEDCITLRFIITSYQWGHLHPAVDNFYPFVGVTGGKKCLREFYYHTYEIKSEFERYLMN